MDIVEFFELCNGKWFSQRTSYHLASKQSEGGKADLLIELLDKASPEVVRLCEQYAIDPAIALCGARITGTSTPDFGKPKSSSTLLVPIADGEQPNTGKLLREAGSLANSALTGRYVMGTDDALTLIAESDTLYSEERLWFASPNLRFRTSLLRQGEDFSMASFFSEIRMGVTKPPEN